MRIAEDQLSYTVLFGDAPGAVTAVGAEPGEVVRAGGMIVQVAREGGRDAVFDVPEQLMRTGPRDPVVEIALTNDPQVKATGRVREVAPQADPATRTFQVKVGITDPPEAMRLGATVTGRITLSAPPGVEVPASALTKTNGGPAVWVVDPHSQTVTLRSVDVLRYDPATVVISQGLETGDVVVTAGAQTLRPGQKVQLAGGAVMNRFNLSEWAIRHRSLVTYFMLVIVVAGVASYLRLGRSEDPDFTVKTMVVQVGWPGATVGDTIEQITDRLERKLQETPNLDYLKSYTTAGKATIFVYLKDSTPPAQVPDIWYQVRKKVGDIRNTLPQDIVGPGFNDEFGDTYGIVYGFTADGFTHRELRDHVEDVRKQLLQLADISKIDMLGAQDERVYVEFSTEQLAGLGIDRAALIAALQAQNAVTPAGVVQTGDEKILVRVSGDVPVRAGHPGRQLRGERPDHPPGRHRARDARPRRPGAARLPCQWKRGHRARDRDAHGRRRAGPRAQRRASDDGDHGEAADRDRADTRRRSGQDGRACGRRFHGGPVGGRRHRPRRQPDQPRPARGGGGGDLDPARPRRRVRRDDRLRDRPAADLARRADHRPRPLGR